MIAARLAHNRFTTNRIIRETDAVLHFDAMAWLIRKYGSPTRPKVPSPLHKSVVLEDLVWSPADARSVFDWAEDSFGAIKSDCRMEDWSMTLVPRGEDVDPHSVMPTRELLTAPGQPTYAVDLHGRPVFFYDPRDCTQAGQFTAQAVLRLADLRLTGFESEAANSPLLEAIATLCAAAYSRQGLTLANLSRETAEILAEQKNCRAVSHRIVLDHLCFSTCLALRVRRQSPEQIIATYGTRMSKACRKKIAQACKQIDAHPQDLRLLQVLSEPKQTFNGQSARLRSFGRRRALA